jgi:predicted DNA binding CopG/RHH family protein
MCCCQLGGELKQKPRAALVPVNTRLYADDLALLKRIAAERRIPYQIELRQLVHRALKGEKREILMLKEEP